MPPTSIDDGVQAYRVTLSPKQDILPECEHKFVKWASKNCDMSYVVAEHGASGKRHLHALLLFPVKRAKHIVQNYIWQHHVKPYHPDSIQKIAVLVNAAFDFRWRDEYLQKEEDKEVLLDKWDLTHASKYLPTQEEQEALVDAKEDHRKGRCFHEHRHWQDMAGHFKTWYVKEGYPVPFSNVHPHHCLEFLNNEMLHGRMLVMVDPRRRQEKAIWLWRVVTDNTKPTDGEKQALEKHVSGI